MHLKLTELIMDRKYQEYWLIKVCILSVYQQAVEFQEIETYLLFFTYEVSVI